MAVYLSLQEVRERLLGGLSQGDASGASLLLERFFNDLLAALVGEDPRLHWAAALAEADRDREAWRVHLLDHVYRRMVAPFLLRYQSDLQTRTEPVCLFWDAAQGLCDWLAHLLWSRYQATGRPPEAEAWGRRAFPFELEVHETDWAEAVRLTDTRGSLWRVPGYPGWCVIGMNLEPRAGRDELGEACLYNMMLEAVENSHGLDGPLAIISFTPLREERLYEKKRLEAGQRQLKRMIGQWADVLAPAAATALAPKGEQALTQECVQVGQILLELLAAHGMSGRFSSAPMVEPPVIQFAVTLDPHTRVGRLTELAERIKERLKLRAIPLIDCLGGQLMIQIERTNRPIVFFWPTR